MGPLRRYQLVFAKLKYLKKDLEVSREIFQDAKRDFSKKFIERVEVVDKEESDSEEPETEEQPNSELSKNRRKSKERISEKELDSYVREEKDSDIKKVFKQIAKKTHPDLLNFKSPFEKERKERLFKRAKTAAEEDDYFELSEIAKELKINVPNPKRKHLKMLYSSIQKVEQELKTIKGSVAWLWYHEEDPSRREMYMQRYIDALK